MNEVDPQLNLSVFRDRIPTGLQARPPADSEDTKNGPGSQEVLSVVAVPTKWHDPIPNIVDLRPPAPGSKGRHLVLRGGAVVIVSEALFFPPLDYRESQM